MKQTILTFVAKVNPERVSDLNALLDRIAADVEGNALIPFPKLKLLHFGSLVLNDDPSYGTDLVFENNFDGPLGPYLDDLYAHASAGLHSIYSCCLDYPAANAADKAAMLAYLRAHVVHPNAYHIGNVGRSVERTHQEDDLRDGIEDFLDDVVSQGNIGSPSSIRQKVQAFVQSQPPFAWAANAQPRQTAIEHFMPRLNLVIAGLIALVLLPLLIPLAIIWVIMLRWIETHEPPPADLEVDDHVRFLVKREDRTHMVQNQMCHITIVKPGVFRRVTLRGLLWVINLIARTSDKGELSGIPSIHFAHWALIDKGRRLLFFSNFDGSWENYLDDFIDKASNGLTGIWSNTVDYPKTRFLILDGSRDGSRFKEWARDKQVYTNVWYSAYKQLTVQTVDNNSSIREGLITSMDDSATRAWLRRF
ncbi:MAG TPA: hypothetical protein VK582_16785 [Pyrinomonadaceae bacterium]|nr:hypothetical protein [Pyrinomonadaceae bacterium]